MTFKDFIKLYEKYKKKYGNKAYKHISELFDEAKIIHKKDWLKAPTPGRDFGQSLKPLKGYGLENLILYIIQNEVEALGLKVVSGKRFEKKQSENLSEELSKVKRNVSVDFGEFGLHVPDADLIIYNPRDCKILAILSSKTTLRERIAQTGYWKIKLSKDSVTKHIKVFFVSPDEDGTFTPEKIKSKSRAIVEVDTDGSYVMTTRKIVESEKVKTFDKFIEDLRNLVKK